MQNDTFQLPDQKNEASTSRYISQAEVNSRFQDMVNKEYPAANTTPSNLDMRERLGHLGLNEGLDRISRNDDNNEWLETGTENMRTLTNIGEVLEQERETIRNDYESAA